MSATSRYEFPDGDGEAHVQAAVSHQSDVEATLTAADRPLLGRQPAYTTVDLAIGGERGSWSAELIANAFDEHGQAYHYPSCTISICGTESIQVVPITPRLINLRLGRRFR